MGGKKISALTESTTVPSNSYTIIVDGTVNKKIKLETITKNLSDKVTDLENELSVNTNKVNEQETTISNISDKINAQGTTISNLSNKVNTQETTTNNLSDRLIGLEGELSVNINKVNEQGTTITNLSDKVDAQEIITNSLSDRVNEVNEQLETVAINIPSNKEVLKEFSDINDDLYYKGEKITLSPTQTETITINNEFNNDLFNNISNFNLLLSSGNVSNGILNFTSTEKYGACRKFPLTLITSHKYYISLKLKSTSQNVKFQGFKSTSGDFIFDLVHSGNGSFELKSTTFTHNGAIDGFRVIDYRDSDFDVVSFKEVMIVDLTKEFGAGNEPSATGFESYLSGLGVVDNFFNGTFTKEKTLELPKTNTLFPIYVDKLGDVINVISKYNATKDIRYVMTKKGVNNIFDFKEIYMIDNNSYSISNKLIGDIFFTNNTDFFAPYKVKAINNIDGDSTSVDHLTGGNHGYTGGADGTPTGRTSNLKLSIDGREVTDFKGYCNFIDIVWTNYIQAMNTKKADGTGREVLKETYELHFDGYKWTVKNTIEILEDVNLTTYYGLQLSCLPSWSEGVYYNSSPNRKWNVTNVMTKSNSKTCDCISVKKGTDRVDVFIDKNNGIGDVSLLQYVDYNAFMESYGKAYFFLIYGTTNLTQGDILTFQGGYRFYSL